MKRFALCWLTILSLTAAVAGFAQQVDSTGNTFDDFEGNMFFVLRIAGADCLDNFADALCYVHDYSNFFDFKDAFTGLALSQLEEVSRWRQTELRVGNEASEVFRASYRLRGATEMFDLIYTQGVIILTKGSQ